MLTKLRNAWKLLRWEGRHRRDLYQASRAQRRAERRMAMVERDSQLASRPRCVHCGGLHARYCPRVARLAFYPDGKLQEAQYRRHFSKRHIVWPEDLYVDDN